MDKNATAKFGIQWKNPETLKRYMTIENEDGSYEFHRFYIGVTHLNLRPDVAGVGYKAAIAGSNAVLSRIKNYGYKLWINPERVAVATKACTTLDNVNTVTASLKNFDVRNYGETSVYGSVFVELQDGTVIESTATTFTLRSMMETIAATELTESQLTAVKAFVARFADAMASWNIDSIR